MGCLKSKVKTQRFGVVYVLSIDLLSLLYWTSATSGHKHQCISFGKMFTSNYFSCCTTPQEFIYNAEHFTFPTKIKPSSSLKCCFVSSYDGAGTADIGRVGDGQEHHGAVLRTQLKEEMEMLFIIVQRINLTLKQNNERSRY